MEIEGLQRTEIEEEFEDWICYICSLHNPQTGREGKVWAVTTRERNQSSDIGGSALVWGKR